MEYLRSKINYATVLFYFVVAFSFTILFLGFKNISFTSIDWIFHNSDMIHHYVGWNYFKNDAWRFPLGSNPTYGLEHSSSIIYSDSIPLLAFFFKIFKNYLPYNFQYFSLWIFLCFFLQGFISFKLINHYTNNISFSLIASFFFLISPIFIYRLSFHLALGGHWLILASFYIQTFQSQKLRNILWNILIACALLVHFYIAASCIIIYSVFFASEIFSKKDLMYLLKKISIFFIVVFLTMYLSGYFMIPTIQTLGVGYGITKLNLLGILDPFYQNAPLNLETWSLFLPDLPSNIGEYEGFSYLGLGVILLAILAICLIILDYKSEKKLLVKIYNKKIYIFLFFLFLLISLSNKIHFGSYELIHLEINKHIYGLLSLLRTSGRLFWPSYYLIFIFCIILIFKGISLKKNIFILFILLLVQIIDTSSGYKQLLFSKKFQPDVLNLTDKFWEEILIDKKILKTTYVRNATDLYKPLAYYLSKNNVKTDIFWLSRYDRKKAAESRYKLYTKLSKGIIDDNPYIIGKKNHLLNIKENFKQKNLGFFLRDNFWIIIPNAKNKMSENDIAEYNKINFPIIELNKKIIPTQNRHNEYFGIGWTHNFLNDGLWSEGYISTILFKTITPEDKNIFLEIETLPSLINNEEAKFNIFVNNNLQKTYNLNEIQKLDKIVLNLEKSINNSYKVDIKFSNLTSPLDILQSPDARKLGILLKSIQLKSI
tara:strand:+ start:1 stop:2136 length:2136 start_codon:yes stop_codon:yes gene_type:complete